MLGILAFRRIFLEFLLSSRGISLKSSVYNLAVERISSFVTQNFQNFSQSSLSQRGSIFSLSSSDLNYLIASSSLALFPRHCCEQREQFQVPAKSISQLFCTILFKDLPPIEFNLTANQSLRDYWFLSLLQFMHIWVFITSPLTFIDWLSAALWSEFSGALFGLVACGRLKQLVLYTCIFTSKYPLNTIFNPFQSCSRIITLALRESLCVRFENVSSGTLLW